VKKSVDDLAMFGGRPAFDREVCVGRPSPIAKKRFFERIETVLDSGRLTNDGPTVRELEFRLSALLGVRACVAVSSGTVGLQIAARAAGLTGAVIVPAFTFVATAHALDWIGLRPVFCDVEPGSLTLDPARVEELLESDVRGILGVHLWGRSCDVAGLDEIARGRGLVLFFDAAHALGSSREGSPIGGSGHTEVFSLHATKALHSFEGGFIATNDDEVARIARRMRNFGLEKPDLPEGPGTNGKMTEVAAAMGLVSLDRMGEIEVTNRARLALYRDRLDRLPGARMRPDPDGLSTMAQFAVLEIEEDCPIGRDLLAELLRAEGVGVRRYFWPGCHRCEPYSSREPRSDARFPVTEWAARRFLSLPTGTAIEKEDVERVSDLIRFSVERGEEIRAWMRKQRTSCRLETI
jgi:dTDP-4-amino-4,6-dideoxyglucose